MEHLQRIRIRVVNALTVLNEISHPLILIKLPLHKILQNHRRQIKLQNLIKRIKLLTLIQFIFSVDLLSKGRAQHIKVNGLGDSAERA
jgi:hypothetical protein